jgi:hypothetical protein
MFQTKVVEKMKTHFLYNNLFFFFPYVAVYKIMWKNFVEPNCATNGDIIRGWALHAG